MIGASDWTVVAVTTLVVGAAVFFHFEVIAALNRWTRTRPIDRQRDHHHRPTLLLVISVLLGTHIAEIWLFGGAFWLLINTPGTGAIVGYDALSVLDCIYFSASSYTTVGWGDLNAVGAVRFLAGTEAIVGFLLITWSASFTYLVMDRTWGKKQDD